MCDHVMFEDQSQSGLVCVVQSLAPYLAM
ncbi:hypothetical protein SMD11_6367 [Streptomyces albireticuli]|uniref:Uncharacterized protein n=1 Tax=Streptomyces albireticuli TaxID=1940 RepID=A0A1Z2LCA4_9ACTN|nr:hypothetical protein SMD11_6367 [Streptomyces albireticuli]